MSIVKIQSSELKRFILDVLVKSKVRNDVAESVADGLVETSLRGVDSHGVRLIGHYLKGVKGGRINPNPKYGFNKTSASTGTLDADHTFGIAAGIEGAHRAIGLATDGGTGHVAIFNSSHFGAAAIYTLEIARHDMIGLAFTNTDALVRSFGGKRPFLGNNPISFAVPLAGEDPFCLDMATSIVTFNKIRQLRESGEPAPAGVGADKDGAETTDAERIAMLTPVGGHKGYGLSMMIEILCSLMTGMPWGPHIPKMFEAPMSTHRTLGHFVTAMRIDCFQDKTAFKKRFAAMIGELRSEPPIDPLVSVQVAGDPEKNVAARRSNEGIPLSAAEAQMFADIGREYGLSLKGL